MNDKIKISVVMSVYNEQFLVERAIKSILLQTFSEFEFIIIDDCSTDNSLKVIKKYKALDKRIVVIENEVNKGLARSLNIAIQKSKSNLIARMDADDISYKNRLQKQFDHLINNKNIDIVGTAVNVIDNDGKAYTSYHFPENHVEIVEMMKTKCSLVHPTTMYRKSVIQAVGGYNNELRKGQDYDLWCRLIGRAIFSNLSKVYLDYYMPKRRPIKKIFYIFWQLIKASPTSLLPWRYLVKYLIPFLKRQ